jgi:hypothetical protein
MNRDNFQVLLRGLEAGDTIVLETPKGKYIAEQCKGKETLVPKGSVEKTIESRLQYEIYGEYPLSQKNKLDWNNNVKGAFSYTRFVHA